MEYFKRVVENKVLSGEIDVCDRRKAAPENSLEHRLFFDGDFYFFSQQLFDRICDFCGIKGLARRKLKQQLYETGALKIYEHTKSRLELGIDFYCKTAEGTRRVRGFALKRGFWDEEVGGFSLAGSGNDSEEND